MYKHGVRCKETPELGPNVVSVVLFWFCVSVFDFVWLFMFGLYSIVSSICVMNDRVIK